MKTNKINARRMTAILLVLIIINIAVIIASVAIGSVKLTPKEVITGLFGSNESEGINAIVSSVRLPRMLGSVLAGIALSVSGLLLQTVTDNKLSAPNIIGVNSGAGFAVMLALALIPTLSRFTPVFAFFGALTVALLVISIAGKLGRQRTDILILSGVAVGSLFSAGISFLELMYPDALVSYTSFSVGGFSGIYIEDLILPSIIIAVFLAVSVFLAPKLNALCLGDSMARSLGVKVELVRFLAVISASALSAAAVSFAGLIGFVGLIVPNIGRRLVGSDVRRQLPVTALLGAAILTLSDLIGRIVIAPSEAPSGIIMSLIGVPFFLFLLVRRSRNDRI